MRGLLRARTRTYCRSPPAAADSSSTPIASRATIGGSGGCPNTRSFQFRARAARTSHVGGKRDRQDDGAPTRPVRLGIRAPERPVLRSHSFALQCALTGFSSPCDLIGPRCYRPTSEPPSGGSLRPPRRSFPLGAHLAAGCERAPLNADRHQWITKTTSCCRRQRLDHCFRTWPQELSSGRDHRSACRQGLEATVAWSKTLPARKCER